MNKGDSYQCVAHDEKCPEVLKKDKTETYVTLPELIHESSSSYSVQLHCVYFSGLTDAVRRLAGSLR